MDTAAATVIVFIATARGVGQLVQDGERAAARAAETVLRGLGPDAPAASFRVACADPAVAARLTGYLRDLKAQVLAERALGLR